MSRATSQFFWVKEISNLESLGYVKWEFFKEKSGKIHTYMNTYIYIHTYLKKAAYGYYIIIIEKYNLKINSYAFDFFYKSKL